MSDDPHSTPQLPPACSQGHAVPADARFCSECGEPRIAQVASESSRLTRRAKLVAALGAGVTLCVAAVVIGTTAAGGSDQSSVTGSITIIGGGGYTKFDPCGGRSGSSFIGSFDYSDLDAGTPVRVLAADGTLLGSGRLSAGDYVETQEFSGSDGCTFRFDVRLDDESTRYQLEIGDRDPYDFVAGDDLDLAVGPTGY